MQSVNLLTLPLRIIWKETETWIKNETKKEKNDGSKFEPNRNLSITVALA